MNESKVKESQPDAKPSKKSKGSGGGSAFIILESLCFYIYVSEAIRQFLRHEWCVGTMMVCAALWIVCATVRRWQNGKWHDILVRVMGLWGRTIDEFSASAEAAHRLYVRNNGLRNAVRNCLLDKKEIAMLRRQIGEVEAANALLHKALDPVLKADQIGCSGGWNVGYCPVVDAAKEAKYIMEGDAK